MPALTAEDFTFWNDASGDLSRVDLNTHTATIEKITVWAKAHYTAYDGIKARTSEIGTLAGEALKLLSKVDRTAEDEQAALDKLRAI